MAAIATPLVVAILTVGAIFQRVKTLEKRIDKIQDWSDRLSRLEGKIDLLITQK